MKKIIKILIFFTITVYSQEKKIDKRITDEACDCISRIDRNLPTNSKGDSIAKCITVANIKIQMLDNLLNKTKKDSLNIIVANKDNDEIQNYLFKNCKQLKILLMTNDETGKNTFSKNEKAIEYYKKGDEYSNKQNYKAAIKEYKKATDIDPNFAFAWDNLGYSYRKIEDFNSAVECYKKSLSIDPKGHMPLQNICVAYEFLKEYKQAIKVYQDFIKFYPDDPEGYYGIGRMYFFDSDYENGFENIVKAYKIYKDTNSPYIQDAENTLVIFYKELKKMNRMDLIEKVSQKHKIKFD